MRNRISYANVVSTLALILAVGTGGAWAATQINGSLLKKNSVAGNKLRKATITHREVNEAKMKQVPKAKNAQTLGGLAPSAFLPAGAPAPTATNAEQLGGIPPSGFVQGQGKVSFGRTSAPAGDNPNVVKTFTTPVGEFRLACGNANADARYHNTTPGDADVFRAIVGPTTTTTNYDVETSGNAFGLGYSTNSAQGPHFVDIRAGKGDALAIMRVAERRTPGGQCIFNWELVTG